MRTPATVRPIRLEAYDATSRAPRVADWDETLYSPNTALDAAPTARARSQDAVRNNPWIRRALKLLVSHLIGCGSSPGPKLPTRRCGRR